MRVDSEHNWQILELAIQPDHIHLFVRVQPDISASEVVQECKRLTSRELRLHHKPLLRLPSLWTRSYFASTAGKVSAATMARYIAAQPLVLKAYTYRLYPSKPQQRLLESTLETPRPVVRRRVAMLERKLGLVAQLRAEDQARLKRIAALWREQRERLDSTLVRAGI